MTFAPIYFAFITPQTIKQQKKTLSFGQQNIFLFTTKTLSDADSPHGCSWTTVAFFYTSFALHFQLFFFSTIMRHFLWNTATPYCSLPYIFRRGCLVPKLVHLLVCWHFSSCDSSPSLDHPLKNCVDFISKARRRRHHLLTSVVHDGSIEEIVS